MDLDHGLDDMPGASVQWPEWLSRQQESPLSDAPEPCPGRFCCLAGECIRCRLRNPNPMPRLRLFRWSRRRA